MAWARLGFILAVFMISCSGMHKPPRIQSEPDLQNPIIKTPDIWIAPNFVARTLGGDSIDVSPRLLHTVLPAYPLLPHEAGIEGVVVLELTIGLNGEVKNSRVIKSNVPPVMQDCALSASQQWRFQPVEQDGKPVECKLELMMIFALR